MTGQHSIKRRVSRLKAWQAHAAGAGAFLAVTAAAYFVQLGPLISQGSRRAELERIAVDGESHHRALMAELKQAEERVERVGKFLRERPLAFQPRGRLNDRLAAIAELATACGMQVDAIEPGADQAGPRYTVVPVRLVARGSFAQARTFQARLRERMPDCPAASVEMTATPSGAAAVAPAVQCSFDLLWHTSGKPPAVASN